MVLRFGLLSDTHGLVHPAVHSAFAGVSLILHAGDVGDGVLEELETIAPVAAIAGNNDFPSGRLPLTRTVELPFGLVGMAHGHEQPVTREARSEALRGLFPKARLILFGHSHLPHLEQIGATYLLNPGAACRPRFQSTASLCVLEWHRDPDLLRFDFQPLAWEKGRRA